LKNEYKSISTPLAGKIKNTNPNTIRSNGLTKITIGTAAIYGKVTKGIVPAFDQLVVIENNQIIYSKDYVLYQFNQNEIRVIKILEKALIILITKTKFYLFLHRRNYQLKITTP
jgi:hypothetical protein